MNFDETGSPMEVGFIEGVHIWTLSTSNDLRGRFFKAYVEGPIRSIPLNFHTYEHFFTESKKNVFRGMHFQGAPHAASKIITIVQGKAVDFLLDLRKESTTYGRIQIQPLDGVTPISIYVPEGVAHGYIALMDRTIISYRQNKAFCANCDGGVSGRIVEGRLPIALSETIRSDRDMNLQDFVGFEYQTKCNQ